jgi:hypothetical protein
MDPLRPFLGKVSSSASFVFSAPRRESGCDELLVSVNRVLLRAMQSKVAEMFVYLVLLYSFISDLHVC